MVAYSQRQLVDNHSRGSALSNSIEDINRRPLRRALRNRRQTHEQQELKPDQLMLADCLAREDLVDEQRRFE